MLNITQNLALQSLPAGVGNNLGPDFAGVTVKDTHDRHFVRPPRDIAVGSKDVPNALHFLSAILVHVLHLAANKCLVYLNLAAVVAAQFSRRLMLHGLADAMHHEPCSFLGHADAAGNLVAGHAILAVGQHPCSHHPLVEDDRAVLEDRSNLEAELPLAAVALPDPARLHK